MLRLTCLVLFLLAATGCQNRVLPGIGFGPNGRIIEIDAEQLRREAELILEERLNLPLNEHWLAEVELHGSPVESPRKPYAERWRWPHATVKILLLSDGSQAEPPVPLAELQQIAQQVMLKGGATDGEIRVALQRQDIEAAALLARTPGWLPALRATTGEAQSTGR